MICAVPFFRNLCFVLCLCRFVCLLLVFTWNCNRLVFPWRVSLWRWTMHPGGKALWHQNWL